MRSVFVFSLLILTGTLAEAAALLPVKTRDNSVVTEKTKKHVETELEPLTAEDYEDAGFQDLNPKECEVLRQYTLHILRRLIGGSHLQEPTKDFYLKFKCWDEAPVASGAAVSERTLDFNPGYYGAFKSEDAVATVLAHEISHHLLKHEHLIIQKQDEFMQKWKSSGQEKAPDDTELWSFYRTLETEADNNVVAMLLNAGYSVAGGLEVNTNLGSPDEGSKSHPTPGKRREILMNDVRRFGADLNAPTHPFPPHVLRAAEIYFSKKDTEMRAPIKNQRNKVW